MGIFVKEIKGSPLNVVYKNFSKMKIVFWKSNNAFVTSSFPLLIDGYERYAYRIVFPISSNNAVVLFAPEIYPFEDEKVIRIPNSIVDDTNRGYLKKYKDGVVEYLIAKEKSTLDYLKY